MFSKNKEVLQLMVDVLGDNVHQRRRENRIWFKGNLVKYPFENDLAALPKQDASGKSTYRLAARIDRELPGNTIQPTREVFTSFEKSIPYLGVFLRVLVGLAAVVVA